MKLAGLLCLLVHIAAADQLGLFSDHGDVGENPKAGSAQYDATSGEYRITGGGANVWGAKDAFQFVWTRLSGDVTLTADIQFPQAGSAAHRKALLMIRTGLQPDSAYADVAVHGDGLTSLQYRSKQGDLTQEVRSALPGPVRVRLERRGDQFTAYAGDPGKDLTPFGPVTVPMTGSVYVGLGVCSHDAAMLETATFRNVRVESGSAGAAVRSLVTIYNVADGSTKVIYTAEGFYQAPNWSPDGRYLLLNTPGKLWRLAADGSRIEPIETGSVKGINNDHGISLDGKTLAISAGNIYTLPSSGGEPKQITNAKPSYFHGFSPDGRWMAFCAQRDGNFDIYRIPITGGAEERLTSDPGYDDGAEYSPDGKWIYFNSNRSGSWDIWRMPAGGAGTGDAKAQQVTRDQWEDWFPHVSPDGKQMVFVSFEQGVPNHPPDRNVLLRMMPAPSEDLFKAEPRTILRLFGGQGTINVNSWSPDSRRFAFVSYELLGKP